MLKHKNKPLMEACEIIAEITGSCPLDSGAVVPWNCEKRCAKITDKGEQWRCWYWFYAGEEPENL